MDAFFHDKFVTLFSMLFGISLFLVGGERGDKTKSRTIMAPTDRLARLRYAPRLRNLVGRHFGALRLHRLPHVVLLPILEPAHADGGWRRALCRNGFETAARLSGDVHDARSVSRDLDANNVCGTQGGRVGCHS